MDLEHAGTQRWALALTFLAFALGVTFVGWKMQSVDGGEPMYELWIAIAAGAVLGAIYLVFREGRRAHGCAVTTRTEAELPPVTPEARVGHPYRAGFRRVVRLVAPPLSGKSTAVVLMICMIATATALPTALHLSVWIELEIVALLWWTLWTTALSLLLYRGYRVSDDYVYGRPRLPWDGAGDLGDVGCDGGCGEAVVALVVLLVVFIAAWVLVELVVPAVFFFAYVLVRGGLARVANDRHDCKSNLARSVGWGAGWATAYVAPLALVVWLVHTYVRLR